MPSNAFSGSTTPASLGVEETLATMTSAGNYLIKLNPANLVADEELNVSLYDKVLTGDTTNNNLIYEGVVRGDQSRIIVSIPISVVFEATLRITQTNGTLREFDWAVVDMS